MARGRCHCGEQQLKNGNCPVCREHGPPVQCVGRWATEKHHYLHAYIDATWAARRRFANSGSAFVDVFAGPGRAKRTDNGEIIDGSPLIAARHERAPFTRLILAEMDPDNARALRARMAPYQDRVQIVEGDSVAKIDQIINLVPPRGLNLALVDPFGPAGLRWTMIEALSRVQRMDLIIHFPTVGSRRNEHLDFDPMVGNAKWRQGSGPLLPRLVGALRNSLATVGYPQREIRDVPVKNTKGGVLYHLVFAAKHPLGETIWKSIVRTEASGQRGFGW